MNTDHVVFSALTQAFACLHCGGQHIPPLPLPITQFVSMGKGFELMHKHCQKAVPPSPQLPLPHTDAPMAIGTPQLCGECGARHRIGENTLCPGWRPERSPYAEFPDPRPMLGVDGSSDEPDPETDPPPPDLLDTYYPIPRTTAALRNAFEHALTPEQMTALDEKAVESWHPDSGIFQAVSRWARVMWAREDAPGKPPVGMYIPLPPPVPEALKQALGLPNKMPRKKATTRKAGK